MIYRNLRASPTSPDGKTPDTCTGDAWIWEEAVGIRHRLCDTLLDQRPLDGHKAQRLAREMLAAVRGRFKPGKFCVGKTQTRTVWRRKAYAFQRAIFQRFTLCVGRVRPGSAQKTQFLFGETSTHIGNNGMSRAWANGTAFRSAQAVKRVGA